MPSPRGPSARPSRRPTSPTCSVATLHFAIRALGTSPRPACLTGPPVGYTCSAEGMAIELPSSRSRWSTSARAARSEGRGRPVRARGPRLHRRGPGKPNRIRVPYSEALETHRLGRRPAPLGRRRSVRLVDLSPRTAIRRRAGPGDAVTGAAMTSPRFGWIMQPAFFETPRGSWTRATSVWHASISPPTSGTSSWPDRPASTPSGSRTTWAGARRPTWSASPTWPGWPAAIRACATARWCAARPSATPPTWPSSRPTCTLLTGGRSSWASGRATTGPSIARSATLSSPVRRAPGADRGGHPDHPGRLWTESPATFRGEHYGIDAGVLVATARTGPIPLMIGGGASGRRCRWWPSMPTGGAPTWARWTSSRQKARVLADHCAAAGPRPRRDRPRPGRLGQHRATTRRAPSAGTTSIIVAGTSDQVTRELEAFREAGASSTSRSASWTTPTAGFERFVGRVMPRLV